AALAAGRGLFWDLAPALAPAAPLAQAGGQKELARWWADLAHADARRAYAAVWRLAEAPEQATAFLRRQLRPATSPRGVRKHIQELDSETFEVRQRAEKELEALES